MELVDKERIDQHGGFEKWNDGITGLNVDIEVFIEKTLLTMLNDFKTVEIDASIWNLFGHQRGQLYIKKRASA